MSGPLIPATPRPDCDNAWLVDRIAEARSVVADVAHHSDHLIRLACHVLARHGMTEEERSDARLLFLIVDARRPVRCRCNDDVGGEVQR